MKLRVAIYARYSHERQNWRSIEDQIAICRAFAESKGWEVVLVFSDAALSGSSMVNRPGILNAVQAAERDEYDILLTEDEDRLSRNLADMALIADQIAHSGAELWTMSSGKVETIHVAFKGVMAQDYIRNLSAKTKRGMHSNAEKGLATGARTYGYRGHPGGAVEIVEAEAGVVRRIFAAYAAGDTPRDIALSLNADGMPGPKGGLWNASTISGNRARGNGILNTELYVGVKVWGRDQVRKDRRTGKRVHHYLPPDEWKRTPVPDLRIVDDETWKKVRERKDAASRAPQSYQRRPTLFGGLLRCGCCGGSYTTYTTGKLICLNKREGRGCTNRRTPQRSKVESRVLEGLREQMLSPEATAAFVREYAQAAKEREVQGAASKAPLLRRLGEVDRGINRAVDAIIEGVASEAVKHRLRELEGEKTHIEQRLADLSQEPETVVFHPATAERYAAMVAELEDTLPDATRGDTEAERRLTDAVRGLIDRVVITPRSQQRGAEMEITIEGTLQSLLSERRENARLGDVVAGGGLEPPTCGL